jgi:hypothetical protein
MQGPGALRYSSGGGRIGQFVTAEQGQVYVRLFLTPEPAAPCSGGSGTAEWSLGTASGTGTVRGTGTFSFQPAASPIGACQDLGTLTVALTVTAGDLEFAGAVGGGTLSAFGGMQGNFAASLDLHFDVADPIDVRTGTAVLLPQGDLDHEGPVVDTDFGVATLRLQLHEVLRTTPCPGRSLEGTWSLEDADGSVGGIAYSTVGPDYAPLGMCSGVSVEHGPIDLTLWGDPAVSTGTHVGTMTQGSFRGIATNDGVWEGEVTLVYRPAG